VLGAAAGQVHVQPSPADLLAVGGYEAKPDLHLVTWYQHAIGLREHLSVEQPGPERRHRVRIGHLESHRFESQDHLCTLGRVSNVGGVAGLIISECMIGMC
jgi:hypothetical protein